MTDDASTASRLRKALLKIDGSKAIGSSEAVSNLLGFPHWTTSFKVVRITTLPYLAYSTFPNSVSTPGNVSTASDIPSEIKNKLSDEATLSVAFSKIVKNKKFSSSPKKYTRVKGHINLTPGLSTIFTGPSNSRT